MLLASRAYRAHKRNLHLRATPALSLHPEKARNKRNEFYAVERRDKVQASPRRRVSFERLWPPGYIAKICNSIIMVACGNTLLLCILSISLEDFFR